MNPKAVLMVRPHHFGYNPETAASNAFQQQQVIENASGLALAEFEAMVKKLRAAEIEVWAYNDRDDAVCPDAVFPNNWLVIMPDQGIVLFPMEAESRRQEVNLELVESLKNKLGTETVLDLTEYAEEGQYLEGTGSIIFDHEQRWAYACESPRTNVRLLSEFCAKIGYEPISFQARDAQGQQIYHTNVLMSVGSKRVVVCLDAIEDAIEKSMLKERVRMSGKEILDISFLQMSAFAGNALEVNAGDDNCWVLSLAAWGSLKPDQRKQLESDGGVCVVEIPTIEKLGGGSAQCMMAGVY